MESFCAALDGENIMVVLVNSVPVNTEFGNIFSETAVHCQRVPKP